MSGFFLVSREALEHPLLQDAERFRAWIWLLAKACWKATRFDLGGKTVMLERGQLCVSRSQLSKAWGMSDSAVERFLTRLKTEQMIERETGQGRTVITICNYEKYQTPENKTEQATGQATGQRSDSHRTAKEQGNKETREPIGSQNPLPPSGDLLGDLPPERPKPKAAAKPKAEAFTLPDWIPVEPWNGYLAMRMKIKKPPTDRALKMVVNELEKLRAQGHDPGKVLDQSTRRSWIDVYKLKDDTDGRSQRNGGEGDALDRAHAKVKQHLREQGLL